MNRMNTRSLVTTIVVFVVCLIIVTGSTFSLFTDYDDVNIAITSGKVEMIATIDQTSLKLYSKGVEQTEVEGEKNFFQNHGYATLESKALTLTNITPGDKVIFEIELNNTSNIDIQYCVTWTVETLNGGDESLANALVATADGTSISTLAPTYTPWIAADADNKTIEVAVELPLAYEKQTDSNVKINFHVEAVQANGYTPETKVESVDELTEALAEAESGEIINADGVTLALNGAHSIPTGVTVKGLAVTSNNSNNYVDIGVGDEPVVFEECTFDALGSFSNQFLVGANDGGADVVFNNCTFTGAVISSYANNPNGNVTFINCTFTIGEGGNGYVTCMGGNQTFVGCTFDFTGGFTFCSGPVTKWSAINIYSESKFPATVTLDGCTLISCTTFKNSGFSTLIVK